MKKFYDYFSFVRKDKLFLISILMVSIKILLFYLFLGKNILEVKSLIFSVPGSVFVFFSIIFLFKTWGRKAAIFSLNLVVTFLLLAQLWYIRYFGTPLSFFSLLQTSNLSGLGPSIIELIEWKDVLFIADIIILFFSHKNKALSVKRPQIPLFLAFLLLGMVLLTFKPLKNHYVDGIPYSQIFKIYDRYEFMLKYNPLQYSIIDIYLTQKNNRKINLSKEERESIESWYNKKDKIREDMKNPLDQYNGIAKGKNVLLLQVESLENWVLNKKVNGKDITPNLNRLLSNSIYASNFYPQTNGGRSSDAEFVVNTSLFPVKEGSTFFRFPGNHYSTLPSLLKEEGYSTFAFHGDEGSYWNRNEAYSHMGIDDYQAIEKFKSGEKIGMGLSDEEFFHQTVDFLNSAKKPFYSMLITLTSHTPFIIPEKYRGLEFENKYSETSLANYLQSIHYTDMAIGKLINDLKTRDMLADTLIVIYGDHAGFENSYKKQMMKENPTVEGIDKEGRVPFIVYNPEIVSTELTYAVGQVDVFPTIAYMMGVPEKKYADRVMGRNILTTNESFAVIPLEDKLVTTNDMSEEEKRIELKALKISDLIIRSDYFQTKSN
ncbi:LTA synthase family protein [Rossellomorea aquimaris]|uniref:LTA synthase family protein n=1 Tax=Rossellomorea aquimaris TaxID=189382 RepID=UPI001CD45416|nr:LTA synthase family protein [Rossellomorea aquimaris]MCA1060799.1 LTA synthase family protein [Rossellomorea aquimaris]